MAVLDKSIGETCTGCGICFAICPMDVFRLDEATNKSIIKYLDNCVACGVCALYCPSKCIEVNFERKKKTIFAY